ncbi:MAG: DUF4129 domain-containing protein [Planctomycetota bacterium]|nr:MAG: DUF4129 domain-containing protein [Planctomycetota bacterium]
MQLERARVALRPRGSGEALDLGLAMLRTWFARLLAVWCLTGLPVLVLCVALLGPQSYWTLVVWWWLAPLLERPLVFVLSRAVFDALPDARTALREVPRLWTRQPLRGLLLHRLDPTRAVVQPVALLEGISGAALRNRESQMRGGQIGACLMLMKAAAGFELVVALSLVAAAYFFVPAQSIESPEEFAALWFDPHGPYAWLLVVAAGVAYSFGCLVRASAGFALYLNRRTELEGWDLEIALRLLARRASGVAAQHARSLSALWLAAWLGLAVCAAPVGAQEPAPPSPAPAVQPADPPELARAILEGPEFKRIFKETTWLPEDVDDERAESTAFDALIGPLLEVLLWTAAIAAFAVVIWWIALRVPAVVQSAGAAPPAELFGLDIRPESLPADVAASAASAWRAGDARAALSLLYRGAIARLVHGAGLEIEVGDTEQDCVVRVRAKSKAELANYFADLTRAWTAVAWSHEPVRAPEFDALCAGWRRAFERSAA